MAKLLVIGRGPAGVSAAVYARRGGAEVTVLAKDDGALARAEQIENVYGLGAPMSGAALAAQGVMGARRLGVAFADGEAVSLMYDGTSYTAATADGAVYTADAVVLATGAARVTPRIDGLARLEGHGVSYCAVCDAFFYRGKTAAVLGAGAYALHEAATLAPVAGRVILLTDGAPAPAGSEAYTVYTQKVEAVLDADGMRAADADGGADVKDGAAASSAGGIMGGSSAGVPSAAGLAAARVAGVRLVDGTTVAADGVFVAVGTAGSTAFARTLGVVLDGAAVRVDENMATNLPGLFAAGDATGGLLQVVKAAHEGAVAGLAAVRFLRGKA